MEHAVGWLCSLLGVTDPAAISVAIGVVAGGLVMLIAVTATGIIASIVAGVVRAGR